MIRPYPTEISEMIQNKTIKVRKKGRRSLDANKSQFYAAVFPEMFTSAYSLSHGGTACLVSQVRAFGLREIAKACGGSLTRINTVTLEKNGKQVVKRTPYIDWFVDAKGATFIFMIRSHDPNKGQTEEWVQIVEQLRRTYPSTAVMYAPNEPGDITKERMLKGKFTHTLNDIFTVVGGGNPDTIFYFLADITQAAGRE